MRNRIRQPLRLLTAAFTIFLITHAVDIAAANPGTDQQDKKPSKRESIWERDWDAHERLRDERFHIDKALDAIGIEPGMVVAEVGGGFGYVIFKLADRIGPTGKVYHEEIWEEAAELFKTRMKEKSYSNIEMIIGTKTDPMLPPKSLDFVFIHATMREIQKPVEIINNIAPALKQDGKLVIIEQEEGGAVGTDGEPQPKGNNRTRQEYFDLFSETVFQVDSIDDTMLPYDTIFVLSVKRAP